jgi:glycosyltransferase involved in cell wall biosynthesis
MDAWVAAIQALQADPGRRAMMGETLRQEASRYTWEGRAENILKGVF